MSPFFKALKGLTDIDVSHFAGFYSKCDYNYSFRHYDHLVLKKKYAKTNTLKMILFLLNSRIFCVWTFVLHIVPGILNLK